MNLEDTSENSLDNFLNFIFNYSIEYNKLPRDMTEPRLNSSFFSQFARIGKALSSPVRLEMIYLLLQGEQSVERLAGEIGISMANASQHLQQLKSARLVDARKDGHHVLYRPSSPAVADLLGSLQRLGEAQLLEVQDLVARFITGRDGLEPVSLEELLRRVSRNEVTVLDVRPEEEYEAGHLPRAISIPADQLLDRLHERPEGKEVIAYCRGPYCLLSVSAVEMLRNNGFKAFRLEEGYPEWTVRNQQTETGGRHPS